jgi:hypothetical protein
MKRFVLSALVAVLVAVASAGCGGSGSDAEVRVNGPAAAPPKFGTNGEPDDPSTLDKPEDSQPEAEWAPAPNFASFVTASHAAIVGRVLSIAPARWNTKNGKPADARALVFRDATVAVDEVIYDSATLSVKAGQQLTVRLLGDGTDTGAHVDAGPIQRTNAISGPVATGDTVLWVLGMAQFPFLNDDMMSTARIEPIPKLVADFYGAWRIDVAADRAISALPVRTVPYRALVTKLKAVRAVPGTTGVGTLGRDNPLE